MHTPHEPISRRYFMRSVFRALLGTLVAVLAVGAVSAAPAFALGRPLLETKPATAIRGTEATLNAVVNANGVETKYYFECGLAAEKTKYVVNTNAKGKRTHV
jgi:hypothetical protein